MSEGIFEFLPQFLPVSCLVPFLHFYVFRNGFREIIWEGGDDIVRKWVCACAGRVDSVSFDELGDVSRTQNTGSHGFSERHWVFFLTKCNDEGVDEVFLLLNRVWGVGADGVTRAGENIGGGGDSSLSSAGGRHGTNVGTVRHVRC
jgi:hypothetical protein